MKPFSRKTSIEIYLEYVNDWLTVEKMADNYNRSIEFMNNLIDNGRIKHENNANRRDLFDFWELIPKEVNEILERYNEDEQQNDYVTLARLQKELNAIGYNFNYGLDAEPYGLHKMKFFK